MQNYNLIIIFFLSNIIMNFIESQVKPKLVEQNLLTKITKIKKINKINLEIKENIWFSKFKNYLWEIICEYITVIIIVIIIIILLIYRYCDVKERKKQNIIYNKIKNMPQLHL
jgi:hypothetical protein